MLRAEMISFLNAGKEVLISLEKWGLNCSLQRGSSSSITQIAGNSHLQSICGPNLQLYWASLMWGIVPELGGSQSFKTLLLIHILVWGFFCFLLGVLVSGGGGLFGCVFFLTELCCPSGVTDEFAAHVPRSDLKGRGWKPRMFLE